jgi:ornithine cyclodeaminase
MPLRILNAFDVAAALSMPAAIEIVKDAYACFSSGQAVMPLRGRMVTDRGTTLMMAAHLKSQPTSAVKIVSVFPDNVQAQLPVVSAVALVLDASTGHPLALMDGDYLTALRTGAGGGIAADLLARPDAACVALFGAGVQARAQLEAVLAVRNIDQVYVIGRSRTRAEAFCEQLQNQPGVPTIEIHSNAQRALQAADIVITATTSTTPVFDGRDLRPGTHITAVGSFRADMQEVDAVAVGRARVIVDSREACEAEAGDLIQGRAVIAAEIGEVINGTHLGRQDRNQITLFKSVGIAVQDAAVAAALLSEAEKLNLGTLFEL